MDVYSVPWFGGDRFISVLVPWSTVLSYGWAKWNVLHQPVWLPGYDYDKCLERGQAVLVAQECFAIGIGL